jgi:hypothetical protein
LLDRSEQLAFLPFGDEAAAPLLAPLPETERLASWHLAEPGGHVASRGEAAAVVLDCLVGARSRRSARRLDRLYNVISRHRSRLGALVPDRPGPRRFP